MSVEAARKVAPTPLKRSTRRGEESEPDSDARRVDLHSDEIALLLRACRKYRGTLPTYLQAVQAELVTLDGLIEKLVELEEPQSDD